MEFCKQVVCAIVKSYIGKQVLLTAPRQRHTLRVNNENAPWVEVV